MWTDEFCKCYDDFREYIFYSVNFRTIPIMYFPSTKPSALKFKFRLDNISANVSTIRKQFVFNILLVTREQLFQEMCLC